MVLISLNDIWEGLSMPANTGGFEISFSMKIIGVDGFRIYFSNTSYGELELFIFSELIN